MLCVVCPHCHQVMSSPEDSVNETVGCPACKKSLQIPPHAPRLPKHLNPVAPAAVAAPAPAKAAMAAGGRGGAGPAVAAPPAHGAPPLPTAMPATARSRFPKAVVLTAVLGVLVVAVLLVIALKPGSKKAVVKKNTDPVVSTHPDKDKDKGSEAPPSGEDLTAADLFQAFSDNELSADETFKDKEVQFSGVVSAVGVKESDILVDLYGVSKGRDLSRVVRCHFTSASRDRLKTVRVNDRLHIRGMCKGKTGGRVILRECKLVN